MPELATEACAQCASPMVVLMRVVNDDRSATVYLRCQACAHLDAVKTPPPDYRGAGGLDSDT